MNPRSLTISRAATTASFTPSEKGVRLEIPEQLGPVKLLRPLGEGGMGVVWLGRHELLARDVAVKFLLDIPRNGDDPNFAAFLQGARAAAALRHPGLNEVHHADVTGPQAGGTTAAGVPYLVMEYIDGPSLADIVRRLGPLPLPVARAIIASVCGAVAELHDHEVIHRDIKPANIMLTGEGRVVVTDFGLACPRPAASFGSAAGALAGTPAYMAPEMFEGIVSARTDVYALGITAFQLLAGRLPFEGTVGEIKSQHREKALDQPMLQEHHVPEPVIEAIERAANKNVLFRPKSARHVLDLFEEAFKRAGVGMVGSRELAALIRDGVPVGGASPNATPQVTYYDTISTLAAGKRKATEGQPPPRVAKDDDSFFEVEGTQPLHDGAAPASKPPASEPKSGFSSWLRKLLRGS
jgi:serine/threonine-protein kinase